jgi:hypothetical protein
MLVVPAFLFAAFPAVQGSASREPVQTSGIYKYFGSVVGRAGDVNQDGTPDMLVGDPGYFLEATPPRIWIVSGANGSVIRSLALPPHTMPRIDVDGGRDLDGDAVPDFIVSARPRKGETHPTIYFVSGASGRIYRTLGTCTASRMRLIQDQDKDGVADVGVLCPKTSPGFGTLTLYSGRSGSEILAIQIKNLPNTGVGSFIEQPARALHDPSSFAVLFEAGTDDSDHGASGEKTSQSGSTLDMYSPPSWRTIWEQEPIDPHYWVNAELARIGDIDGDGVADIAAGYEQTVIVVSGETGRSRFKFVTQDPTSQCGLGCSLAALGDIDGDDVPDFAIGEYDPGLCEGRVVAKSGKTGLDLWSVFGDMRTDNIHHLGYRLAALGDLDGDKVPDLAVGTDEGPDGLARGAAEIRSGKTGARLYLFRRNQDAVVVESQGPKARSR